MCVGIGSFSDPFEAQGLAHFLGLFIYLFLLGKEGGNYFIVMHAPHFFFLILLDATNLIVGAFVKA